MKRMGPILRLCATLFGVCLALLLSAVPASAATTDLPACFRPAGHGETVTEVLANPSGFDCTTHQNSLPPGDYWVRLSVPKSTTAAEKGTVFRTASLWDKGFELWAIQADDRIQHYTPYRDQDISPLRLGGTVVVPLIHSDQPIIAIYARVARSAAMRGVMQQSQLSSNEEALRYEMIMAVLYAAFAGLCIALLVYNLALWRGMREPFLLAYCGMMLATLVYAFFTSGAPYYFSSAMSGPDRLRLTVPLLAINAAAAMVFIRHFFEASNIPKWLVRLTYVQAASMVAFALFYAAMLPAQVKLLDAIYVYSFVTLPFIVAAYVVVAWKRRDPYLAYFLAAWSAPAIATALRTLFGLDVLPYNILIENSSLIALALEALISSLAIGRRVRMLAVSRDRAEIAEARAMVMADTDALTGLPNRRAFVRKLLEAPRDWQLVLVDIDHFKRINDTLGHVEGDDVLIRLSDIISSYACERSIVARLGGEEFAIATLAPFDGSGLVDPEELLAAIRRSPLPGGYRITASIGIARRVICDEQDWKVLYRAADMALYRAKSEGRDRHVDYSAERIAA
jgi:diguanylate cyclase (GGDEF)-like protein